MAGYGFGFGFGFGLIETRLARRSLRRSSLFLSLSRAHAQTNTHTHARAYKPGAEQDKLVDREGVEEMAEFADAGAPVFLPLAHDVMLVSEWRTAAQALLDWLGQD